MNREIDARRTAKDVRSLKARGLKRCKDCQEALPTEQFPLQGGYPLARCRPCYLSYESARSLARRQSDPAFQEREAARQEREASKALEAEQRQRKREAREERKAAKAQEAEQRQRERKEQRQRVAAERQRARVAAEEARRADPAYQQMLAAREEAERERKERRKEAAEKRRRTWEERRSKTPEQLRREADERIAHLTALLMGTATAERINSAEGWDSATAELQRLWAQSGDKECVSCKAMVPPSAMLPPGPANFYPGKCQKCARAESIAHHVQVFGRPPDEPRLMPMRVGTAITVAEFARRVAERQASYRLERYGA